MVRRLIASCLVAAALAVTVVPSHAAPPKFYFWFYSQIIQQQTNIGPFNDATECEASRATQATHLFPGDLISAACHKFQIPLMDVVGSE